MLLIHYTSDRIRVNAKYEVENTQKALIVNKCGRFIKSTAPGRFRKANWAILRRIRNFIYKKNIRTLHCRIVCLFEFILTVNTDLLVSKGYIRNINLTVRVGVKISPWFAEIYGQRIVEFMVAGQNNGSYRIGYRESDRRSLRFLSSNSSISSKKLPKIIDPHYISVLNNTNIQNGVSYTEKSITNFLDDFKQWFLNTSS